MNNTGYYDLPFSDEQRRSTCRLVFERGSSAIAKASEQLELDPQIRLIVPNGGIILFSGTQTHSSVPNNSGKPRFSIDFRAVHEDDVKGKKGALRVDKECTGTM